MFLSDLYANFKAKSRKQVVMKNGKNIMPSHAVIEEFHRYRPQPVRTTAAVQTTKQYMEVEKRHRFSRIISSFSNISAGIFFAGF